MSSSTVRRLIYGGRRYDYVTPLLQQLHWLSVMVMVYRCLHGIGPEYFSEVRLVSEIYSRQRLRSASSTDVVVPATRQSSLGDRAFPVARARSWNALPPSVTSAPSLSLFRRLLKTFFSFPATTASIFNNTNYCIVVLKCLALSNTLISAN